MNKYTVRIARTETRLYEYEVEANSRKHAEELAKEEHEDSSTEDGKAVWAEEDTHEIIEETTA